MCTIHITPRCRRPARGQIFLKKLKVDGDSFSFSLPSRHFRLNPAPSPRVMYATDARAQAQEKASGIRLVLPGKTERLITTAIWQVTIPDIPEFDALHVIQWILPSPLAPLMSDNTWLWPAIPGAPALSAGDWPVMDTDPSTLRRVRRRSFSVIDTRNRKGYITRRFQCFPLAPLPPEGNYDCIPDFVIDPGQEKTRCTENIYLPRLSQP
ncbi:TPA: conjugal transfer protein TraV [Salmonella enterica subsp. enterica serovar Newport]|uniref:Conjugal transfer protein TraV n=3 Tax=Salmonella enterica TaxID=28901 RepID=A0A635CNA2_SALTM|nr:conjugal transfer protein TraV [Salmonella enterica subsp. enterica serovar Newport str. CDC 2010K-2159]EAC0266437.1 conjugal transfer protein TraV [Salmonella enterica subsp. enterica serovar Typhimurium]ECB7316385.1 conjugal transfer protein TraV [Salmonella enterica subsp. enterica serovar Treforest]ECO0811242.1 conjugal transfer protein TraV [Salmonella enterica subsp. enterica serovar Newport]EDV4605170.1 conjugal transfer protein TraV [Salmonella enterica subsp. enterica]EIT5403824.1 